MLKEIKERDDVIIHISKKLKALQHLHEFANKIHDRGEMEDVQRKLAYEMKITMFELDNIIGKDNFEKYVKIKIQEKGLV